MGWVLSKCLILEDSCTVVQSSCVVQHATLNFVSKVGGAFDFGKALDFGIMNLTDGFKVVSNGSLCWHFH